MQHKPRMFGLSPAAITNFEEAKEPAHIDFMLIKDTANGTPSSDSFVNLKDELHACTRARNIRVQSVGFVDVLLVAGTSILLGTQVDTFVIVGAAIFICQTENLRHYLLICE
eukprot:4840613-Amphidinium_carterae.1